MAVKTVTLDIKCSTAVFEAAMIAAHLQIDTNTNTYNPEGKNLQGHKECNPGVKFREEISRT